MTRRCSSRSSRSAWSALIIWFHHASGRNTLLSVALGLLLGGALGNMIDRFRLGYVVDFVDVGIGDLRFYTFNVADSAISLADPVAAAQRVPHDRRNDPVSPGREAPDA